MIGFPALPPYYALGIFTGSRTDTDWAGTKNIENKLNAYIKANMPIEGVIVD